MAAENAKLSKEELREDEFVEWIMNAVDFVRDRAQLFIAGAAGIVVLILGINYFIDSQDKAKVEAAALLGDVLMAEQGGQMSEAIRLAEQLVSSYGGTPAAGQGRIVLANRYLAQGRFADARKHYEGYLSDYGQKEVLSYAAWGGIAACLEAEGRIQEAAQKYLDFAAQEPGTVQAAMALMEAARCFHMAGDLARQKEALQNVVSAYGKFPISTRAREELDML